MGINISGIITDKKISEGEIEKLLEEKLTLKSTVSFEEAIESVPKGNAIDVLHTNFGTIIFMDMGCIYEIHNFKNQIVQFMIIDISDTYWFEKYDNGKLLRKFVYSQGDIGDNIGEGIVNDGKDVEDVVWEIANEYLKIDFLQSTDELTFNRYSLK